ncbi:LOW QUALITY PROTEIN: hypothetical protein Cgig2_002667 [Carnegiea gigantea]|uniref:Uncharacterized protein n=1 Tax=Carnegiea gigantea TaxID=171969 RepID=A0A9Q1K2Q9_9CARY|nr:LOW QUALITY PROTEIN: hypothetical protein Cgig2_002667 [Carnegiea gigantea]
MGGKLEDGEDGKVTYVRGLRKCILLKEGTRMEEVQRMGNEEHGYFMWMRVMGRRGEQRSQVHHTKGERGAVIMAWFAREAGEMGMMWCKRVPRDQLSDDDEISVTSEDVGDEETQAEGGEEGSKGRGEAWEEYEQAQDIVKSKNGVGERIEQKLADTYKKVGCITAVECYNLMLREYNVELTNNCKLVVKLGQQICTCRPTYECMATCIQFMRVRPNNSYTTS